MVLDQSVRVVICTQCIVRYPEIKRFVMGFRNSSHRHYNGFIDNVYPPTHAHRHTDTQAHTHTHTD